MTDKLTEKKLIILEFLAWAFGIGYIEVLIFDIIRRFVL